jgi:two-component sensor histidine kinase/integral membrane sensor domain MASE1
LQTRTPLKLLPGLGDLPALGLLAVAYGLAAVAGLQWTVVPGAGSAVWPAAGIGLAALVIRPRLWPALYVGRLAAALTIGSPQPLWADLAIALISTAAVLVPAAVLHRSERFDSRLGSLSDVVWLVGLGALAHAVASAPLGLTVLWLSGTPVAQLPEQFVGSFFGASVGVLLLAPAILTWSRREAWRTPAWSWLHLAICLGAVAAVSAVIFLSPPFRPFRTWHLFPVLVWAALAFSVRGASLALILTSSFAIAAAILDLGPLSELAGTATDRLLVTQQFMAVSGATMLILAAVADERRGREQLARSAAQLRAETEALEALNETGTMIAAELDQETLVQKVTDAAVALTGAEFGAFFYNVIREDGGAYMLYTLSGAPRSAFESFGMPRDTAVFHPTFAGEGIVRSQDITRDPRYGKMGPHYGMPKGHLPVRSYLAAPVRSRSGEVLGGLFFGHSAPGMFDARDERIVTGLAAQAAIGIDKARVYEEAQREIARRAQAEQHQRLLINELNHRVKNTLATVQSIAAQTARGTTDPARSYEAFIERLMALSRAHDVLTRQRWEGAALDEIVAGAMTPFGGEAGERFAVSGPKVWLEPQSALALAMALHELATNASKYGALSVGKGRVAVDWTVAEDGDAPRLALTWRESGGPAVKAPRRKGFGSRLLERGLPGDLGGTVALDYRKSGLVCTITARLRTEAEPAAAD